MKLSTFFSFFLASSFFLATSTREVYKYLNPLVIVAIEWQNEKQEHLRLEWSPFKHLYNNKNTAKLTTTTREERKINLSLAHKDLIGCNPGSYHKARLVKKVEAELPDLQSSRIKAFFFSGRLHRLDGLHTILTSYEDHQDDFRRFFQKVEDQMIRIRNNKKDYKIKHPKNTLPEKNFLIKTDGIITHRSSSSGYNSQQPLSDPFENRYNKLLA